MSFLGNLDGPKESEIVEKLGPDYFGSTWSKLEDDIAFHRDAERRSEVVPVKIDDRDEPYILFSSPDKKGQRLYLLKEGYPLRGSILCLNEKGEKIFIEFK
jgi:hypothetical protein